VANRAAGAAPARAFPTAAAQEATTPDAAQPAPSYFAEFVLEVVAASL